MLILASKYIYPQDQKDLKACLFPFKNLKIQLSFFQKRDFLNLEHQKIKETCDLLNIEIPTVHAPTVDIFDEEFIYFLNLIKEIYKVKIITIHPQKGTLNLALEKFKALNNKLINLGLTLAYENFPSNTKKRKWIYKPKDMYEKFNLAFLKITFDTAHLDEPNNCLREFKKIYDKVEIIHLSDRDSKRQHLPLGEGRLPYLEFLEYLKNSNFKGFIVLEYLGEFQDRLILDLEKIREFSC